MVECVQAFKARDGSVHLSEVAAHKHDAGLALKKLAAQNLNEAQVKWILDFAHEFVGALKPFTDAIARSRISEPSDAQP